MFKQTDLQGLSDLSSILALSDREFEYCCKFLLEKAGYGKVFVTQKGPMGGDGGIDLDIYASDGSLIACGQCKLWKGRYNGLMKPVRELCGSMKIKGVSRGIFIITANATDAEKREARLQNIEMIDAEELLGLIRKCKSEKEVSVQMKQEVSPSCCVEVKSEQKKSHPVIKAFLTVVGIILLSIGYAALGAIIALGALVALVVEEMLRDNEYGYHQRRYYHPRRKYRRYKHRHGFGY